jgi:hypothetical protein
MLYKMHPQAYKGFAQHAKSLIFLRSGAFGVKDPIDTPGGDSRLTP